MAVITRNATIRVYEPSVATVVWTILHEIVMRSFVQGLGLRGVRVSSAPARNRESLMTESEQSLRLNVYLYVIRIERSRNIET